MSADADFTMTTAALLRAAVTYTACQTFHVNAGESRHYCSECDQTEQAHIIVALLTALANAQPLPGEGENDFDEEHRTRRTLTSAERQQGLVDEGHEDWLEGRDDR